MSCIDLFWKIYYISLDCWNLAIDRCLNEAKHDLIFVKNKKKFYSMAETLLKISMSNFPLPNIIQIHTLNLFGQYNHGLFKTTVKLEWNTHNIHTKYKWLTSIRLCSFFLLLGYLNIKNRFQWIKLIFKEKIKMVEIKTRR